MFAALSDGGVEFILVGGLVAIAHGSARLTQDVGIVYSRNMENLRRLQACLGKHHVHVRGTPAGLPFRIDLETLQRGPNFTLSSDLGSIVSLGEISGGGGYAQLRSHTVVLDLSGIPLRCPDLETLIAVKRAAGRPKDFEAIGELEALLEQRDAVG